MAKCKPYLLKTPSTLWKPPFTLGMLNWPCAAMMFGLFPSLMRSHQEDSSCLSCATRFSSLARAQSRPRRPSSTLKQELALTIAGNWRCARNSNTSLPPTARPQAPHETDVALLLGCPLHVMVFSIMAGMVR